jgi:hypothetical protein
MTAITTEPGGANVAFERPSRPAATAATRQWDHVFFAAMSIIIASVFFVGFARTYYLAGIFHAKPLPAPIVHVHGALFTSWILLLVAQTSLASAGRTNLHRKLGLAGLVLAPLLVVLGLSVAVEMLVRFAPVKAVDSIGIFAVAISEMLGFAAPTFFAFRLRRKAAFHKRLILIGTIAMTTAGFGRWPVQTLLHRPLPAVLAMFGLLAVVAVYDLLSLRKLHRATVFGVAWVVFVELAAIWIGPTTVWHNVATHIRLIASGAR